jgi:lipopolysaccharide transport system permease protein
MAPEAVTHYVAGAPRPFRSFLHPGRMLWNLWSHRDLAVQLAQREIASRYRATRLGLLWSVLTPLFMLGIYTFALAGVLGARWNSNKPGAYGEFALYLYCGLLVFYLFSEVLTKAPTMVVSNANYVKKVVFPLEVLVVSGLLAGLFNLLVGCGVWLAFWCVMKLALPHVTALYLPLVIAPVCLATLGLSWIAAALGVFVRDVGHFIALAVQALFFCTPVFYRIEQVPQPYRTVLALNPLAQALEDARRVMVEGGSPDWFWWSVSLVGSALLAVAGYAFFMKSKRAFADVI